jgi:hypothetical protein
LGTWSTKHYGVGLLAGTGAGLFIAGMLARSADPGALWWLVPTGLVVAVVGGGLYALDRRGTRVGRPADRA